MKKNFKVGDQVRFINLDFPLKGYVGNILGKCSENVIDTYIVSTNKAHIDNITDQLAIAIPEGYLELVYPVIE